MAKEIDELEKRQKAWEKAFGEVKKAFGNVDTKELEDMALQITLTDEDCGGTLYAELKDGSLSVEPYDYKDNDAVLDVTKKALINILQKKLSVDKAIENGDLTVKGDLPKLSNIENAIKAPVKKTVKRATKKTETKAEAKKAEVTAESKKAAAKTETKKTASKAAKPAEKKVTVKAAAKSEKTTK